MHADGSSRIEDTRKIGSPARVHSLNAAETALYLFLDCGVKEALLEQAFLRDHPIAFQSLNSVGGVSATLQRWLCEDLVLAIDGRVVALALHVERLKPSEFGTHAPQASEPVGDAFVQIT
jgi:hypothetical protein